MRLSILLFLCGFILFAQEKIHLRKEFEDSLNRDSIVELNHKGKFRTIEAMSHTGGHIYGGESLKPDLHQFYSTTLKFGWQNTKKGNWSEYYGTPTYGFGLYAGNIGNREVFGNPRAVYGWITFTTSRYWRRNSFQITPHLGLTYQLAKYDPVVNPDNDAISSNVSLYFDMEFSFAYQLNRELDLVYGIDFMHSSNGRLKVPNFGLNMLGLNLGLRYYYNRGQKDYDPYVYSGKVVPARYHKVPKKKNITLKESSISTYFAVGNVENYKDEDNAEDESLRYWTSSVALDYNFKYNTMISFTAGLDYFWDSSLETQYPDKKDWSLIGVHAGADYNFWRMAVRFQAGTYLTDDRGKHKFFMRPAILYSVNDWLKIQVGLKTRHGAGADWIEWGVAFVPFRWGGKERIKD